MSSSAVSSRARQDVVRLCAQGLPAAPLLARLLARVRAAVEFDASFWSAADPATLLPTGGVVHNLPLDSCEPYFEHELLIPDVNKFAELAGADHTVGVLSQATGGDLRQSPRWRAIGEPLGIDDELRVAFVADGSCWGYAALLRRHGHYTTRDVNFVVGISAHIAHGLRTALLAAATPDTDGAPGTVVLDAAGRVEAVTPEAQRWMAELMTLTERHGYRDQPTIPPAVYIVAARARAALAGRDDGLPSARVRTRSGRWLIVHGSPLHAADGPDGRVAVLIEPARPAQIAPVIVAAWQLTDREQDVLRLVCRGLSNDRIAHDLSLSPHTVRGYLKGLFAKAGVNSRTELVAALFANHYHDQLLATANLVHDPTGSPDPAPEP